MPEFAGDEEHIEEIKYILYIPRIVERAHEFGRYCFLVFVRAA